MRDSDVSRGVLLDGGAWMCGLSDRAVLGGHGTDSAGVSATHRGDGPRLGSVVDPSAANCLSALEGHLDAEAVDFPEARDDAGGCGEAWPTVSAGCPWRWHDRGELVVAGHGGEADVSSRVIGA